MREDLHYTKDMDPNKEMEDIRQGTLEPGNRTASGKEERPREKWSALYRQDNRTACGGLQAVWMKARAAACQDSLYWRP